MVQRYSGDDTLSLLEHLPGPLRTLAERGSSRVYRKGILVIQEGEVGDTLYLILAGRVKSFAADARGREITYGVYGVGEYFGEMSLDGGPRSTSISTLEPTSCVLLTRQTVLDHLATHPDFAAELLTRVIARARTATANARSLALMDVYSRMAQLLDGMADPIGDGSRLINERLTHADIASRLGCSREMVSRLLKDLERGGYVEARAGGRLLLLQALPERW